MYEYMTTWFPIENQYERFSVIPVPPDPDSDGEWELINGSHCHVVFAWHWRRPLRPVHQTACYKEIEPTLRCTLRYRHEGPCSAKGKP